MVQLYSRIEGSAIVGVIKSHNANKYSNSITTFWLSSYSLSAPELNISKRKDNSRNTPALHIATPSLLLASLPYGSLNRSREARGAI